MLGSGFNRSLVLAAVTVVLTPLPPGLWAQSAVQDAKILEFLSPQVYSPESHSLATADGMTAVRRNPAAIRVRGPGLYLGGSHIESEWSTVSIFGQIGTLGLGYQHWSDDFYGWNRDQYILGHGVRIGRTARLGFSYTWWRAGAGEIRKAGSYSVGALSRPASWLSLAAKAENLNRPRFGSDVIPRVYRAAVGLRPMTSRLTLTFDAATEDVEEWEDADYRWGLQLEPLDGLLVSASIDQDRTLHMGLGLNFRRSGLGVIGSQTDEDRYRATSYYAVLTSEANRTRFSPRRRVAKFSLAGAYRDEPREGTFALDSHKGASTVMAAIRKAVDDESVSGIFLDVWGFSNMAVAQEIRSEMLLARDRGKKVVAYLAGGGGLNSYLVAAAADTIIMPETMDLGPFGLLSRIQMLKGLMDKLGFEFERYPCRKCEHKSAYFQLTEDEIPEEFREELNSILDDWFDQYITETADGRGLEREAFEEVCDGRLLVASEAKERRLVDILAYSDVADSLTNQMTKSRIVDGMKLTAEKRREYSWRTPPTVAVIAAMGAIDVGENRAGFLDGNVIGSETLVRTIRNVQNDPEVEAVVLRIDSPGGSGYASDIIWYQVEDLKKRTEKPFVSSMGIVAASGGYYIAMNSDKIFADPATITGSIGVTGMKAVTAKMYSKIGVQNEIFKRGEHIDMLSSNRRTTAEERDMILDVVDDFYDIFTSKVAEGRGMTEDEVLELAGGRVYTGRQALENGLVDELGGVRDAIDLAAEMAGIEGRPRVAYYHRPRKSLWQRLTSFGAAESPCFRSIFETRGPFTYSELGAALAEMQ